MIDVDEEEFPPTEEMDRVNANIRIVKPLLEEAKEAEMSQMFGLNFINFESAPQVYDLVRRYVHSILNE